MYALPYVSHNKRQLFADTELVFVMRAHSFSVRYKMNPYV